MYDFFVASDICATSRLKEGGLGVWIVDCGQNMLCLVGGEKGEYGKWGKGNDQENVFFPYLV